MEANKKQNLSPIKNSPSQSRRAGVPPEMMKTSLLIVDDDPALLSLLTDILQDHYHVLAFTSPLQARTIDPTTLLGLMTDWNMPELPGIHLIQELRARRPDLPIIILSGTVWNLSRLRAQFSIPGGWEKVGLVTKPFVISALLETIQEVLHP